MFPGVSAPFWMFVGEMRGMLPVVPSLLLCFRDLLEFHLKSLEVARHKPCNFRGREWWSIRKQQWSKFSVVRISHQLGSCILWPTREDGSPGPQFGPGRCWLTAGPNQVAPPIDEHRQGWPLVRLHMGSHKRCTTPQRGACSFYAKGSLWSVSYQKVIKMRKGLSPW